MNVKEYFVVLVTATYNGTTDWFGGEFESYPTHAQVVAAIHKIETAYYPTDQTPRIHYARVEKRYRPLRMVGDAE